MLPYVRAQKILTASIKYNLCQIMCDNTTTTTTNQIQITLIWDKITYVQTHSVMPTVTV